MEGQYSPGICNPRREATRGSVWGGTGYSPCSRLSFRPSFSTTISSTSRTSSTSKPSHYFRPISSSRPSSSPGLCLNAKHVDVAPCIFLRGRETLLGARPKIKMRNSHRKPRCTGTYSGRKLLSLPDFANRGVWPGKSSTTLAEGTGKSMAQPDLPT